MTDPEDPLELDLEAVETLNDAIRNQKTCGMNLYRWPIMHSAMVLSNLAGVVRGEGHTWMPGGFDRDRLISMTLTYRATPELNQVHEAIQEEVVDQLIKDGWIRQHVVVYAEPTLYTYTLTREGMDAYHSHFETAPA